jgi:hypothetical protein
MQGRLVLLRPSPRLAVQQRRLGWAAIVHRTAPRIIAQDEDGFQRRVSGDLLFQTTIGLPALARTYHL